MILNMHRLWNIGARRFLFALFKSGRDLKLINRHNIPPLLSSKRDIHEYKVLSKYERNSIQELYDDGILVIMIGACSLSIIKKFPISWCSQSGDHVEKTIKQNLAIDNIWMGRKKELSLFLATYSNFVIEKLTICFFYILKCGQIGHFFHEKTFK
jgi:hypothetical protein